MQNRNFKAELKNQFQYGGMHIKLIFINLFVFLFIGLISVLARIFMIPELEDFLNTMFSLQSNFSEFIIKPWGLITSIFAHFGFMHVLFNMLMLYFVGKLFESFFGEKRLLAIYLLGGITGGCFEILAHSFVPSLADQSVVIVGASGSIMAIFIGLAFYKPNLVVSLFGVFDLKIIYLALIYILYDFLSLGLNDGTAHFAHLGGAIIGILAAQNTTKSSNFIFKFEQLIYKFFSIFKKYSDKKSTFNNSNKSNVKFKSDEDFNLEKKNKQAKTDQILEKISKSGYESLSKAEKEFLFKQSNTN